MKEFLNLGLASLSTSSQNQLELWVAASLLGGMWMLCFARVSTNSLLYWELWPCVPLFILVLCFCSQTWLFRSCFLFFCYGSSSETCARVNQAFVAQYPEEQVEAGKIHIPHCERNSALCVLPGYLCSSASVFLSLSTVNGQDPWRAFHSGFVIVELLI